MMAVRVAEKGAVLLTACYSKCDACGLVAAATQFTGPNGYVIICKDCLRDMHAQAAETHKTMVL